MKPIKIKISSSAVVGNIESNFADYFSENKFNQSWQIDLSTVDFIEIASMVYLAQLIYRRYKQNIETKIILPISSSVLIILHTWRFFEIIEDLTNIKILNFIDGEFEKFSEVKIEIGGKTFHKDINKDYFEKYYSDKSINELIKKGFFSLICLPFKTMEEKEFALKNQRIQWNADKLISDVLEKNLLLNVEVGNILANTIIYECLTNAAHHPQSDYLVIGSFFDLKKTSKKENVIYYFTIVIWDNGNSIIKTLKDSIDNGKNIRAEKSFLLAKTHSLTSWIKLTRNYISTSNNNFLYYDFIPDKKTDKDEIFVSSFFPGISRDPNREQNLSFENNSTNKEAIEKHDPGLGLTYLLNAVIEKLNGNLSVRTNEYFLNIKKGNKNIISEFESLKSKSVAYKADLELKRLKGLENLNYSQAIDLLQIKEKIKIN
ncbi:hypothetical protein HY745_06870 [Candidatus Desantisbacteria bacterium]|nr:hypothetical protein [Candidatus Desantisbacteria bacterium]